MEIRKIKAQDTHDLRHTILRPGRPRETCVFDGDDLPFARHLGAFDSNKLMGIVSIYPLNSSAFPEENQLQMRGMAVDTEHQRGGVGKQLVLAAEAYAKERHFSILWFNARVAAVPFYKKMGYEVAGEEFEITDVGPHYVMYKRIPEGA